MEFYLDRPKTLKFQLSSEEMGDEARDQLEGGLHIKFKDLSLVFPAEINENWVATIEIPKLSGLLKGVEREKEVEASLCLHDKQYFYQVWSEKVKIQKSRPEIKAKPLWEDKDKKSTMGATVIDPEPESDDRSQAKESPKSSEAERPEGSTERPTVETKAAPYQTKQLIQTEEGFGLRTYLERVMKRS